MDRRYMLRRLGLFFLPVVVSVIFLLLLGAILPDGMRTIFALLLLGYFMTPLGREVLIPLTVIALLEFHGTAHMGSDIVLIVICMVFVDIMSSLFLLWNLDILKHIPRLGGWIDGMESYGRRKLRKSRRMRNSMFVALALYVTSPFYGSHGVASTIIGMLSGMRKCRIWLAVWAGSVAGSLSIAVMAFTVGQHFLIDIFDNTAWKAASVLVGIGIFISLIGRYWARGKGESPSKTRCRFKEGEGDT